MFLIINYFVHSLFSNFIHVYLSLEVKGVIMTEDVKKFNLNKERVKRYLWRFINQVCLFARKILSCRKMLKIWFITCFLPFRAIK